MKNFELSFELRLRTQLAGHDFLSEVSCANAVEVLKLREDLAGLDQEVAMIAALVFLDTSHAEGGCDVLDDDSAGLFNELCEHLKVGQETFYNSSMGSYDQLTNRVTPADLGHHFPDGTLRLVWDAESSLLGLDETVSILKAAAELLAEMQDMPYFCQTDDEMEVNDWESLAERRTRLLFDAGCWPADDDSFLDVQEATRSALLDKHRVAG